MASTSEVGHAKNVANFNDLIAFVDGFGPTYNPSKDALKLPQLQTLHTEANNSLNSTIQQTTLNSDAINKRKEAFKDLRSLSTRLVNALDATDASPEKMKNAKAFNRKIQGQRASKLPTSPDPNNPSPAPISTSQQSYDQLIQHFLGLVSVLESEPSYAPNEPELQIASLKAKAGILETENNNVTNSNAQMSNARLQRHNKLYNQDNGLVHIAAEVKKYVKSLFGANSPEYKQIQGIKFRQKK